MCIRDSITTEGVGAYGETPEEYLCRMETLHELMAVLDTCTETQRRRFLLYALDGLSLAEIASFVHSPFRHSTSFNIHYLVKVKFFSRNTQRKPCIFLSGIPRCV